MDALAKLIFMPLAKWNSRLVVSHLMMFSHGAYALIMTWVINLQRCFYIFNSFLHYRSSESEGEFHPTELGHISCFYARCNILFIRTCYCMILDSFISMKFFNRLEHNHTDSFTIHNWNVHNEKIQLFLASFILLFNLLLSDRQPKDQKN